MQGSKVDKTSEVHLMMSTFQLTFHDVPPTLKPSLHFSSKVSELNKLYDIFNCNLLEITSPPACTKQLRISRFDRNPLSSTDLSHSAVIEVTQTTSTATSEPTTLTLPVPEDGNVHIQFKLQEQVEMLSIRVSVLIYSGWKKQFRSATVSKMSSRSTVGSHAREWGVNDRHKETTVIYGSCSGSFLRLMFSVCLYSGKISV